MPGHRGGLEEGVSGVKEGFDLGRTQERMDVDEEWVEGHNLRAIGRWLADKSGICGAYG